MNDDFINVKLKCLGLSVHLQQWGLLDFSDPNKCTVKNRPIKSIILHVLNITPNFYPLQISRRSWVLSIFENLVVIIFMSTWLVTELVGSDGMFSQLLEAFHCGFSWYCNICWLGHNLESIPEGLMSDGSNMMEPILSLLEAWSCGRSLM